MFIVKRRSLSGGQEYLVKSTGKGERGYRWDKVARKAVYVFAKRDTARKNAYKYGGEYIAI